MAEPITTYDAVPPHERAIYKSGQGARPPEALPRWSGACEPPPVGSYVRTSTLGVAEIHAYFVQYGWLGVIAKPLAPPEWFLRKNGAGATGHVFGAEIIEALPDPAPVVALHPQPA